MKESVFLDVNEIASDKKGSESNVIDIDNNTNNNDCISFDETVKKSVVETLVNENNQMIVSTVSDEIENINS